MDDMEQYKELFMTEAEEHLQSLNQNMVELENCPEDSERIINMIFRSAHTLKGSARTLGFEHISSLTHHMEDILDYIRDGKIKVNPEIVDLLFKCLDALETMVSEVSDGEDTTSVDVDSLVEVIKSVKEKYLSGENPKEDSLDYSDPNEVAKKQVEEKTVNNISSNSGSIHLVSESSIILIEGQSNNFVVEKPENLDNVLNQMHESASALLTILDALEYSELKDTVKNIDELSTAMLNETVAITENSLSVLKSALSTMQQIAKVVETGSRSNYDYSELNEKISITLSETVGESVEDKEIILDHTIFNLEEVSKELISEINENKKIYHVKSKVVEDCLLKAVRLTMVLSKLKEIGTIISSVPAEENLLSSGSGELDVLISTDLDNINILDSVCEMEYVLSTEVKFEHETAVTQVADAEIPKTEKSLETPAKFKINIKLDEECLLKAVRAYMVIKDLKEKGTVLETEPPEEKIQEGTLGGNTVTIYYDSDESEDDIKEIISKTPEITEFLVNVQKNTNNSKDNTKIKNTVDATSKKQAENSSSKKSQTVRVNIEKLDKLMNLVGEVVINRANFTQIATKYDLKELHNAVGRLNMLATELQEEVMGMRMIPVAFVFNRFPRTVRDTAKALDKEIDFEIEGSDIELDRTVLDELAEPLTHLIRNSLDHGIEHADERIKLGKPEKGILKLIATRQRDRVNIIIRDDGKGIDPEAMRKKAFEKGLYSKEEAEKLTDNEAVNVIFHPGFSTAEVVSDVSGRGVGMDVVRSKIESLGGSVTVNSEVGKGTEITLHLPLTMAIIQTLLIRLNEHIYALPLTSVLDVISVEKEQIKNLEGQEAIIYRNHILPVIWLKDALNTSGFSDSDDLYVVVVEKNKGKVGMILDEVIGRDEIVVKPLTGILKNINGLAGATILGDGRVALILDLNNI
ncbi:two-component system chemotaxis sensor kinase CheA [Methanococcus maripaludis]|uniref:Chemotaxis protein CheA n=1 Tax=Methanococcus maripaludis TaxID=39152 RepID=A0A7J9P0Q5_METMI|nr:chemotaxis protein CheA [Methanococcus maripaludis]MBA2852903.1 two-component system chemotaxis sensor kinase CheA [Methanococcus maripaludis]